MLARVRSAAVLGIDAYLVEVETDIANGLPTFAPVGLPQGAELSVRFVAQQPFKTQIVKLRLECPHVCRNVCRSVSAGATKCGRIKPVPEHKTASPHGT